MKFLETSAKTAENVSEAFITMTKETIAQSSKAYTSKKEDTVVIDGNRGQAKNLNQGY